MPNSTKKKGKQNLEIQKGVKSSNKPSKPGASSQKKGGKTPPGVFNPGDFPALGVVDPVKGFAAKNGVPVKQGTLGNDHAYAAEARGCRRFEVHNAAYDWWSRDKEHRALVTLYPSRMETKLPHRQMYREALFDYDEVRDLKCHKIDKKGLRGKQIALICNDVYVANWQAIFSLFVRLSGDKRVRLFTAGLSMAGQLGADVIKGRISTLWVKRGKHYYCFCPDSGSEYRHVDNRPWKDVKERTIGPYKLYHKQEKYVGLSGIVSTVLVVEGDFKETPPVPFGREAPGAIINTDGRVPLIRGVDWLSVTTATTRDYLIHPKVADEAVSAVFGDFRRHLNLNVEGRNVLIEYERAKKKSIEDSKAEQPVISICDLNPVNRQQEDDFAETVSYLGPFRSLVATLRPKRSLLETGASVGKHVAAGIKAVLAKLHELIKRLMEFLSSLRDEEDAKGKEEEIEIEYLPPCHILFNLQNALGNCARIMAKKAGANPGKLQRAANYTRRIANLLGKPFDAETVFGLVGELLLMLGVVAAERLLSHFTSGWSDIMIGIVEVVGLLLDDSPLDQRLVMACINLTVHIVMAFIPWWISLPIHVVVDLIGTGLIWKAIGKIAEIAEDRGVWTTELRERWAPLKEKLDKIFSLFYDKDNIEVSSGNMELSDLSPWTEPSAMLSTSEIPEELIQKFTDNEAVKFKLKVDGRKIPLSEVNVVLKEVVGRPTNVVYPIVNLSCLSDMALTTSDPHTFLSALFARYSSVPLFRGNNILAPGILRAVLKDMPMLAPLTKGEFFEHVKTRYPASKIKRYEKAFELEGLDLDDFKKEIAGKSREILRWRSSSEGERFVKCRVIYPFPPEVHVRYDSICWSLGVKKILIEFVNRSLFSSEGKPDLRLRIPVFATAAEIEEVLDTLPRKSMTCIIAGDDGYDAFRGAKNKIQTNACDLRSCDTTLGPLIEPVLDALVDKGLPVTVKNHIMELCQGPFHWECYARGFGGERMHFKGKLYIARLNGSGNPFTTLITLLVSMILRYLAWTHWDGEPETWKHSSLSAAKVLRVDVEFEDHNLGGGMNPPGHDTFLSCVPILTRTGFKVIPKGPIKVLLVKGERDLDKGRSLLTAIANRARDPALSVTHYGLAIRGAYLRYLVGKPVPTEVGEVVNPYKISFEEHQSPKLTLDEELTYYQQYGNFTMTDFLEELSMWSLVELPEAEVGFAILKALAAAHYSLGDGIT